MLLIILVILCVSVGFSNVHLTDCETDIVWLTLNRSQQHRQNRIDKYINFLTVRERTTLGCRLDGTVATAVQKMLAMTPESVLWPWMQLTVFSKCLYAVQLIWFVNKMEVVQCTYMDWCVRVVACMRMKKSWKQSRKHNKLYIVMFRP